MTAIAPPDRRWVFGPASDLLIGCGLGYVLLIAFLPLLPLETKTLATVGTFGTLLIGAPHYGATLLRVYGNAEDRRKYAFFTVYLSALVWLWFAVGLYDLRVGSALITLYFTWSPWHYTGQNYGLSVMFLRRRGIAFEDRTKKLLYASFALSFALAFVSLHRSLGGVSYGIGDFKGTPFYFIHLGIPLGVWSLAFGVLGAAYVLTTVAAFRDLLRIAKPADLVPVAALVLAQALWFSLPYTWTWLTNTQLASQGIGWLFVWAILGHSAQYLWITTYYAVGRDGGSSRWRYLFATLGAGSAAWTLPALVFSPQLLGTHPYTLGLFLMIAAAVNVQHFILDGAIWKLRDTGVGSILLARSADAAGAPPAPAAERPWLAPVGWALAAVFTALSLYGTVEQLVWARSVNASDLAAAESSADRLTAIGRADPRFALISGQRRLMEGDAEGAEAHFLESLELYPTADGHHAFALMQYNAGHLDRARDHLLAALEMDEDHALAHRVLGLVLVRSSEVEAGIAHLARAAQLRPEDAQIGKELAAAREMRKQRDRREG